MSSPSPNLPSTLDLDHDAPARDEGLDAPLESPMALVQRGLEGNLKETADIAAATGLLATQALAKRVVMDAETMTTKQLIDVAEHSAKMSGLLKRQEAKDDTGRFIFTIDLGDASVTVEARQEREVIDVDPMASVRATLAPAAADIFADAPEFS